MGPKSVIVLGSTKIGKTANKIINKSGYVGKVHSIFDKSVNIETESKEVVGILNPILFLNPFSLQVDAGCDFRGLGIALNDNVHSTKNNLEFRSGSDSPVLKISLEGANLWENTNIFQFFKKTTPDFHLAEKNADFLLSYVSGDYLSKRIEIVRKGKFDCCGQNVIDMQLLRNIFNFLAVLREKKTGLVRESIKNIVGLGQGLTPAGDDFFVGFFPVFKIYNGYHDNQNGKWNGVEKLVEQSVRENIDRTTLVGAAFLKHALTGDFSCNLQEFIINFFTRNLKDRPEVIDRVIKFGGNSGFDFLLGVVLGIRFFEQVQN